MFCSSFVQVQLSFGNMTNELIFLVRLHLGFYRLIHLEASPSIPLFLVFDVGKAAAWWRNSTETFQESFSGGGASKNRVV